MTDPAGIVRVDDLGASPDNGQTGPADSPPGDPSNPTSAGLGGLAGVDGPASAGFGTLVIVTLISLFVTYFRRRRLQRALAARVAARLATLADSGPTHDSRSPKVDARENAGLSSAEFRASEASR